MDPAQPNATQQALSDSVGKIGDFFGSLTGRIERGITGLFGSSNERRVKNIGFYREKDGSSHIVLGSTIDRINQLEADYEKLSEGELAQTSAKLRARLAAGQTLDDVLPDAFAAVRESSKRHLHMRHYDVQMVGGVVLNRGMIAEMTTGEGKTLVATLPTYLNALVGSVHVVTVNDYLAKRDMEWMGPVHMALGLTIGCIQSGMDGGEKQQAYSCDITYGTNNEFGFDYLRDNMKPAARGDNRFEPWRQQVQQPLRFALVDEIDNILIDEARTPLIISGPAHDDLSKYPKADQVARKLQRDVHFEVKEKEHTCHLTDEGIRTAEKLAGVESFYTAGNMHWPHLIDNSLKAHHLYKKDVHYVVENGDVVIIDEFTGRKMTGRQWSDGLHQAVEAKEGVRIKEETQTLATITLQNYFKLYDKLAGMTGTAMTEADEFLKIYGLDVISVPTNRPTQRINFPDVVYRTEKEKWNAVVDEVKETHQDGRPVLVGTVSIENSEIVSEKLKRAGIQHSLLNAKFHEREAEIIAQAGRLGAVTISTNMAGRGTDIVLGGNPEHLAWDELQKHYASRLDVPKSVWDEMTENIAQKEGMNEEGRKVADLGGLHVIGTERHDSRRIDLQLRGRSGRQGDPGSSRFFVSLEDGLMRRFMGDWVKNLLTRLGMEEGEAIESGMVSRRIEAAQKKVEEHHFEVRKHLLEYDEVMDEQRKRVYSYRQSLLLGANCRDRILRMIDRQVEQSAEHFLNQLYPWQTVAEWCSQVIHLELDVNDVRGMDPELLEDFLRDETKRQAEEEIEEAVEENLPEGEDEGEWNWRALSQWINANYSLNTNDGELKKVGRDELYIYLYKRACEAIDRYDLAPVQEFVKSDWGAVSLSAWLQQQYTLSVDSQDLEGLEPEPATELIQDRVRKMYRDKEVRLPVGICFQGASVQDGGGARLDRERLVERANVRFGLDLGSEAIEGSLANLEKALLEGSEAYLTRGWKTIDELKDRLDQVFGVVSDEDEEDEAAELTASPEKLTAVIEWANSEFDAGLSLEGLEEATRDTVRQRILEAYDSKYRPELKQAERTVILEILDQSWKDHLYFMDHLRSSVSLMSYAQKDPKVEYKREGRAAFESMWDRIGQQVTSTIFRLETEQQQFSGNLWSQQAATHVDAGSAVADAGPDESNGAPAPSRGGRRPEPGEQVQVVAPIRQRGPKVGRNDPCPCGSGKKYKKCCGANA
ncbi:MAG: preprotein translocase subunit SecA [Planctomycetota bacterium]|jgi:preprotein translocase subunit SecA